MSIIHIGSRASEIILASPSIIYVFEWLNIPLGMQDKTIEEVCKEVGISPAVLLNLLHVTLYQMPKDSPDLLPRDALALIDYLLKAHEYYSREATPRIIQLVQELREVESNSSLPLIEKFFREYSHETEEHFKYEKEVAFPYMKRLFSNPLEALEGGYRIREYRQQHNDIQEKLDDLLKLLIKYLPPSKSYPARRRLFLALTDLGHDLQTHTCIEDEMLMPLVEKEESKWKR